MTKTEIPGVERTDIDMQLPTSFVHRPKEEAPVLVLLHGYADSGPSFLRRIAASLDDQFEILAPNGLFPLPQKTGNEWKEAYAWYFYDPAKDRALIPPEVAVSGAIKLIEKLRLGDRPKILCGFSQGGFLLPKLATCLENLQHLVVIGSGYPPEDYAKIGRAIPVTGLHGEDDDIIPIAQARQQFEALSFQQKRGFHPVPSMDHVLDDKGRAKLKTVFAGLI